MQNPVEMYKESRYRLAWCEEEEEILKKQGWSREKEPGMSYVPYTALVEPQAIRRGPGRPPKAEEVAE